MKLGLERDVSALNRLSFKSMPLGEFETRRVAILNAGARPLTIRICGFGEVFRGDSVLCENSDNPQNIIVSVDSGDLSGANGGKILFANNATLVVTGFKESSMAKELDPGTEMLRVAPKRDPDVVNIDGKKYYQTGTVYISGMFYVLLE